ncbi:MAG: nucleotidyltransferase family protein [Prevotella sp.]|nr:nucleotidyltransferase family protein [Prevotella sp.]
MQQETFFKLLRLGLGIEETFPEKLSDGEWAEVRRTATRQSMTGVAYAALAQLGKEQQPPMELALPWMSEAEAIKGLNGLLNQEAARLTDIFTKAGRLTAILKGQANARLYPEPLSRQPGDIDIWVEGGEESVTDLLIQLGLLDERPTTANLGKHDKATRSYHHVHLPPNKQGVTVEVHFRPSSGNFNPITNGRLQKWLAAEAVNTMTVEEGFNVPSMRFALVMQLAHIQHHFLGGGIGLRQLTDYYYLLQTATAEDRQFAADHLRHFGLRHTAGALMWLLQRVLTLDDGLLLTAPDGMRGEWLLREVMAGGNFGRYAANLRQGIWQRFFAIRWHHLQLMRFDFGEMAWQELNYWRTLARTLPERIRRRSWSLAEANKRDGLTI